MALTKREATGNGKKEALDRTVWKSRYRPDVR